MKKKMKKISRQAKNKGGRPVVPDHLRRDQFIRGVRFSRVEIAAMKARATEEETTWTEWVRTRLGMPLTAAEIEKFSEGE